MSKVKRTVLLGIDPQKDFCDPSGALSVFGADQDMERLAVMVKRLGTRLDNIILTLDSHRNFDIAHPMFWKDSAGKPPAPFTAIFEDDMLKGKYVPVVPGLYKKALAYIQELKKKGKYVLVIWPPHCLIGSAGHCVYDALFDAVSEWEKQNVAMVEYVTKGSNPYTEHYSAIAAEVEEDDDVTTKVNAALINTLENDCDLLLIAGEAKSHCVRSTVNDIIKNFSDPKVAQKIVLLTDAMSSVRGFEQQGDDFFAEAKVAGVQFSTTVDILK